MKAAARLIIASLTLAVFVSGCALALRTPNVADLQRNPARYHDKTVSVNGVVTTSWGIPLVPFRLYKIDDGTGELTVISNRSWAPTRGARVRVKGKVNELGTLGGRALGLHIQERSIRVFGN